MKTSDASTGHVKERYGPTIHDRYLMDGTKIHYWPGRVQGWIDDPKKTVPIHIDAGITKTCNARCVFCVRGDSMIAMADGTEKPINDVQVGDSVLSFHSSLKTLGFKDSALKPTKVTRIMVRKSDSILRVTYYSYRSAAERNLFITPEHEIVSVDWVDGILNKYIWQKAGDLVYGNHKDLILRGAGNLERPTEVRDVELLPQATDVFNIETEAGTYVVNDVLVHNCYAFEQGGMTGDIIPRQALLDFVEDAAALGVKSIAWIGDGEPTLNPALWEATELGWKLGVKMAMSTNGIRFDPGERIKWWEWVRFNFSAGKARFDEVMGVGPKTFDKVCRNIRAACEARDKYSPNTHIGLQMVPMPDYMDECVEVAKIGKELGCNYTVIKQCTDSARGGIGPDGIVVPSIDDYRAKMPELKRAEAISDDKYRVIVKWNTMMTNGRREYNRCYGTRFLPQLSGSGKLYTCGPMFGQEPYLLGDITKMRFRDIVYSEQWEKGHQMAESIDVHTVCSTSCRQNALNTALWRMRDEQPMHMEFI